MSTSFTDEDLQRWIEQHRSTIHTREYPTRCSTCRLISRLQAAEKALFRYQIIPDSALTAGIIEAREAWRKAAGKV